MYGNPEIGYKLYPRNLGVDAIRASSEVYLTETFVQSHISHLQHSFVSAESGAESYNENFVNSAQVKYFESYLMFNPAVGGHFATKNKDLGTFDDDGELNPLDGSSQMHELSRKALSAGYYNHQVLHEMLERGTLEDEIFGPKMDPSDPRKRLTYRDTLEMFMLQTDQQRRNELYKHTADDCSPACRKRGCGQVATADGLWKLSYKICMWEPKNPYPDTDVQDYLPNACPEQPSSGSAFCENHSLAVEKMGYPSKLRPFLESCGANPNAYTDVGRAKVKTLLQKLAQDNGDPTVGLAVEDVQGVGYLLRNRGIASGDNFKVDSKEKGDCRKDIGEAPRLHRRFIYIFHLFLL